MKIVPLAAVTALIIVALTGCSAGTHTSPPVPVATHTAAAIPADRGTLGVPKTVAVHGGSSITATLDSIAYGPWTGDGGTDGAEYAVVKVTVKNDGPGKVTVGEDEFTADGGGDNLEGADATADYTPYGTPLRIPTLTSGQSVTGLVMILVSTDSTYKLDLSDDDQYADLSGNTVAQWVFHSAKKPTT